MNDIQLIPFEEIELPRWNGCVHYAVNGNIFGYHWYLKNITREFDALVEGNYESVMPLLGTDSKWGYRKLIHPPELGRLGIFSVHVLSPPRVQAFIDHIPSEYKQKHILFNELVRQLPEGVEPVSQTNWYQLNMNQPYEILAEKYSDQVQKQIDATQSIWTPHSHIKPEELSNFFQRISPSTNVHRWRRIHYNLMHRGVAFPTVYVDTDQNIGAAALLAYDKGTFTLLHFAAKKQYRSQLFLRMADDLIRLHANRPLVFDFNLFNGASYDLKGIGATAKQLHRWKEKPTMGKILDTWNPF